MYTTSEKRQEQRFIALSSQCIAYQYDSFRIHTTWQNIKTVQTNVPAHITLVFHHPSGAGIKGRTMNPLENEIALYLNDYDNSDELRLAILKYAAQSQPKPT